MPLTTSENSIDKLRCKLRQGQILTALVLEYRQDGRWNIALAGVTLPFSSRETLQIGERIILLVERLLPNIRLKRVGSMRNGGVDGRM